MKYRIIAVALVAMAALMGGTTAKAGGQPSIGDVLQFCQTEGGVNYVTNGVYEDEADCESTDAAIADPESGFYGQPICVDGTNYLFSDDEPAQDLIDDLNGDGFSASAGACAGSAAAPPPVGIFLCYSAFQSNPGVWSKDVAEQLLKQGYWLPYAVPNTVAGGTNLGGFHLACSVAATQSVSGDYVGGDGSQFGSSFNGVSGLYPKIGG